MIVLTRRITQDTFYITEFKYTGSIDAKSGSLSLLQYFFKLPDIVFD